MNNKFKFRSSFSGQKGFTAIEALVATALFAFVVTSVLGVYMATLRLDARTRSQRAVAQNARYIMEFLAKEIRNGNIDYSLYTGSDIGTDERDRLHIINQAGESETFALSGSNCTTNVCNITLTKNGGTTNLNSSGVRVSRLEFRTEPDEDPFVLSNDEHVQPYVVTVLELISNYGTRTTEVSKMNLQSTFTVRSYPDRE